MHFHKEYVFLPMGSGGWLGLGSALMHQIGGEVAVDCLRYAGRGGGGLAYRLGGGGRVVWECP